MLFLNRIASNRWPSPFVACKYRFVEIKIPNRFAYAGGGAQKTEQKQKFPIATALNDNHSC